MFIRKNQRHTGMDLRDELIRLACDNRAGAQALSRFGIFPVFSRAGTKVNGRVFHGGRRRQFRFSRFSPFVESADWNQAPSLAECLPEGRRFIDGVDGSVSDLRVFDPNMELIPTARRRERC
jgi:hypothetical protein